MDFTAPYRAQFKQAAAEEAEMELRLRMLCEAVPPLRTLAHGNLEKAEKAILIHFKAHLSADDEILLTTSRQLRNKVLHTDFREARKKLREAGEQPGTSGVRIVSIDSSGDVRAQIDTALSSGTPGKAVANTKSTEEGTVYGWLLELGMAGDFVLAARTFERAMQVVEKLIALNAWAPA